MGFSPGADARDDAARNAPCKIGGTILVTPFGSASSVPAAGLVAIDPSTGETTGTIEIPLVSAVFPSQLPNLGLAIAGDELYLIDAAALSAQLVPLDGGATDLSPNPIQFRGSAGERYMLLGSPAFDRAVLVDLAEATATDLVALVTKETAAPSAIPFAAVVPGDRHVLLWNGQHVFVVQTADPSAIIQLDDAGFGFAPDVSPDGSEVVFSQSAGPGSGAEVIVVEIDGDNPRKLLESPLAAVTLWIPGSRTVLVDKRTEAGNAAGQVTLVDVDTGAERSLLDYSGSLTTVQFSPGGTHALLGIESMTASDWYIVNLATTSVERQSALSGGRALPGLYADSRWALMVPLTQEETPLTRPAYRSVDLERGTVSRLLEQRPRKIYLAQPALSPDGRLALVVEQDDQMESLILLDGAELRSMTLAEGTTVSGVFDPRGCGIAVTVITSSKSIVRVSEWPTGEARFEISDVVLAAWIQS